MRDWRSEAAPTGRVARVRRYLLRSIWEEREGRGLAGRSIERALQLLVLTARGFRSERLTLQAGALTYRTILALVPTLAVAFVLFDAFVDLARFEAGFRDLVVRYLAPGFHDRVAPELERYIAAVRQGTRAGSVVAVLALAWTITRTMAGLDKTVRGIFGARARPAGQVRRLLGLWVTALLGPVLVGASLALHATLTSTRVVAWLRSSLPLVAELGYRAAPVALACVGFAALYRMLAGVPVRWRTAAAGGVFAGVAFEVAKRLFALFASNLIDTRHAVYGSLGVVFVFLLWVYISWVVVLLGAQVAAAARSRASYLDEELAARASPRLCEEVAVATCAELAGRRLRGVRPGAAVELARTLDVPVGLVLRVLAELEVAGLVRELPGWEPARFTLARPAEVLSPAHVIEALGEGGARGLAVTTGADVRPALEVLEAARASEADRLASTPFAALQGVGA
jgi:membrane protein